MNKSLLRNIKKNYEIITQDNNIHRDDDDFKWIENNKIEMMRALELKKVASMACTMQFSSNMLTFKFSISLANVNISLVPQTFMASASFNFSSNLRVVWELRGSVN